MFKYILFLSLLFPSFCLAQKLGQLPVVLQEIQALNKIKASGIKERFNGDEFAGPKYVFWGPYPDGKKHIDVLVFPNGTLDPKTQRPARFAISPEIFLNIKQLKWASHLGFEGTNINDEIFKDIASALPKLKSINIANTLVTDDGIEAVKLLCPKLKIYVQASNNAPFYWQKSYIEYLQSKGAYIRHPYNALTVATAKDGTGMAFAGIGWNWNYSSDFLKQNSTAGIEGVTVPKENNLQTIDFKFLENNTKLLFFDARSLSLTDEVLDYLKHNSGLRGLAIGGDLLDDNSVRKIVKYFPDLQVVGLDSTNITQQGILELAKLKELNNLFLKNHDLSPTTIMALAKDRKYEKLAFRSVETINNVADYSVLRKISAIRLEIVGIPFGEIERFFEVQNIRYIFAYEEYLIDLLIKKKKQLNSNAIIAQYDIFDW